MLRSEGITNHSVWHTNAGPPPGNLTNVNVNTSSYTAFQNDAQIGDVFLWPGHHVAFYAGGDQLFHAYHTGYNTGYTNDLKWWINNMGYPNVYRQTLQINRITIYNCE